MPAPAFSGDRALALLAELTRRAAAAARQPGAPDPLRLREALAATGAALPGHGAAAEASLLARVEGRESGPPWLLCAPVPPLAAPALPPWRPNAHVSGLAVLLGVLECLASSAASAGPQHDVLALLLPLRPTGSAGPAGDDAGRAAAQTWAAREVLRLRGALVVWRVAAAGPPLELDVRALADPRGRALGLEVFALGRALGHAAFAGGAQHAFPGAHEPLLERGVPTLPLCAYSDAAAGSDADVLDACSAQALHGVGDVLLRFLRGERVV
jgi:hypothetical protein